MLFQVVRLAATLSRWLTTFFAASIPRSKLSRENCGLTNRCLVFGLGQKETEGCAQQQSQPKHAERNCNPAGLLLEPAKRVIARPATHVAKGIDHAHHRPKHVARKRLCRDG